MQRQLSPAADIPPHYLWIALCHEPTYGTAANLTKISPLVGGNQHPLSTRDSKLYCVAQDEVVAFNFATGDV
jgi:hypothetical protein